MPDQEAPDARPFAASLREIRNGALHDELTEAIREVTAAVQEHDKQGKLTLTLVIAPSGDGGRSVFITDTVKTQVPEGQRPRSLFYADENGNITRRDPRQPELPRHIESADRGAERKAS